VSKSSFDIVRSWTEATEFSLRVLCVSKNSWLPLWPIGQTSWLQIQRSGFDSQRDQIFWEVVGLEQGPLSLVSTVEELLGRKSSGSSLESLEYSHRNPSHWPCGTLYSQKLALTSLTSGCRSFGKVRLQTQTTEFFFKKNSWIKFNSCWSLTLWSKTQNAFCHSNIGIMNLNPTWRIWIYMSGLPTCR
jgi:hypothetical protein